MFDIGKIADQIGEKIKPTLEQTKKQAELALLVSTATQIYCSEKMRGGSPQTVNCINTATQIIKQARTAI